MVSTMNGRVTGGVIIPDAPLPEGTRVQILVLPASISLPLELREELEAWNRASDKTLELVEKVAQGGPVDEAR